MYKIVKGTDFIDAYVKADEEAKATGATPVWGSARGIRGVQNTLAVANLPGVWTEAVLLVKAETVLGEEDAAIAEWQTKADTAMAQGYVPIGDFLGFGTIDGDVSTSYVGQCFVKQHKVCVK